MILKSRVDVLLKSWKKRGNFDCISTSTIKPDHGLYRMTSGLEQRLGVDLRVVMKGRSQIYDYACSLFDIDSVNPGECVTLEFEDFRVYLLKLWKEYQPRTIFWHKSGESKQRKYKAAILIDRYYIWLPRVNKITLRKTPGYLKVYDNYRCVGSYYRLPKLYYPENDRDCREFLFWLRRKDILCVRYKLNFHGDAARQKRAGGKVRRFPGWMYSRLKWSISKSTIVSIDGDPDIPNYDVSQYNLNSSVDFVESIVQVSAPRALGCYGDDVEVELLGIREQITQELVNEWVERENNRYSILYI